MTVTFVVILNTDIMTSQGRRAVYNNKTPYMQNLQFTNQHNHQYFLPFNKFSIFQASFHSDSNIIVKSVPSLVTKNKFTVNYSGKKRGYIRMLFICNKALMWELIYYIAVAALSSEISILQEPHLQSSWLEIRPRQAVMEISEITQRCEPAQKKEQGRNPPVLSLSLL